MTTATSIQRLETLLEQSPVPVLISFWAAWAAPCQAIEPMLSQLVQDFVGRLKVIKINVEQKPLLAARYRVQGIPLLLLLDCGQPLLRLPGVPDYTQLKQELERKLSPLAGL
jgi:thioredoxin-like negative regulator of GroEL